jgi:hypothetical protein
MKLSVLTNTFSSPFKETRNRSTITSHQSHPSHQLSPTTNLLSVSVDLLILDILYKLNHTSCGFLWWLILLSIVVLEFIQCFIPFYDWIMLHCMDFVYPFINWQISQLLPLFWLLWIMLLWIFMYKFLGGYRFSFLLSTYVGVTLMTHMLSLCQSFFIVKVPIGLKIVIHLPLPPEYRDYRHMHHAWLMC